MRYCHHRQPMAGSASRSSRPSAFVCGRRWKAVLFSLCAALAMICSLGFSFFSLSPARFLIYQGKFLSERFLQPLASFLDSAALPELDTRLTLTGSYSGEGEDLAAFFLDDTDLTLDVKADKDGMICDGSFDLMGTPFLRGCFTYDRSGTFGFFLPDLDSSYYIADLEELVFHLTGTRPERPDTSLLTGDRFMELGIRYGKLLLPLCSHKSVQAEKNVSVELPGLRQNAVCTVYTLRPQADKLEQVLLKVAATAETDELLRDMLQEIIDAADAYGGTAGNSNDKPVSAKELISEFVSALRENAHAFAQEVQESGLIWTLAVEDGNVRQIALAEEGDALVLETTGSGGDSWSDILYRAFSAGGQTQIDELYSCSLSKEGKVYKGAVLFSGDPADLSLNFHTDLDSVSPIGIPWGTYRLFLDDAEFMRLSAAPDGTGGTDHDLTLWLAPNASRDQTLRLSLNAVPGSRAEKPSAPPVDITHYSEDKLDKLFTDLVENFAAYIGI